MDAEGESRKADSGLLKCIFTKWRKCTPRWAWWLTALLFMILGLTLALPPSLSVDGWIQRAAPGVNKGAWPLLIGIYLITIAVSMTVIHLTMIKIRRLLGLQDEQTAQYVLPADIVGICEAALYPTSWLVGKPEFIGVWLALKTAVYWTKWQDDTQKRSHFQMFLVGNALSIVLGSLSFFFMRGLVL